MTKLLMVCMGNICRSPMAQVVTQHFARQVGSAATVQVDTEKVAHQLRQRIGAQCGEVAALQVTVELDRA